MSPPSVFIHFEYPASCAGAASCASAASAASAARSVSLIHALESVFNTAPRRTFEDALPAIIKEAQANAMRRVLLVALVHLSAMSAMSAIPGPVPGSCHWDRADGELRLGGVRVPRTAATCFAAHVPTHTQLQPRPVLCTANHTRHENLCLRRLTQRVARLEAALSSVCSAIVHADDVAYSERCAAGIGAVYRDPQLNASRRPRWLRRSVQQAVGEHHLSALPPETHWHASDLVDELDALDG